MKKSIRLNNATREDILNIIRLHINKKYKDAPVYTELQNQIKEFSNNLREAIKNHYGKDLIVFKKWGIGKTIKSFYLRLDSVDTESINYYISKPFTNKGCIEIEFETSLFVPVSYDPTYTSAYKSKHTILPIITNNELLWTQFKLIHQMTCDIETEKEKILKAYEGILYSFNTTKQLLLKHPKMESFLSFLWKDNKLTLSESEKLIEQFETEID